MEDTNVKKHFIKNRNLHCWGLITYHILALKQLMTNPWGDRDTI